MVSSVTSPAIVLGRQRQPSEAANDYEDSGAHSKAERLTWGAGASGSSQLPGQQFRTGMSLGVSVSLLAVPDPALVGHGYLSSSTPYNAHCSNLETTAPEMLPWRPHGLRLVQTRHRQQLMTAWRILYTDKRRCIALTLPAIISRLNNPEVSSVTDLEQPQALVQARRQQQLPRPGGTRRCARRPRSAPPHWRPPEP